MRTMLSVSLSAAMFTGCTEPVIGDWEGVEGGRYEWQWTVSEAGGEFEWYDRERERTRAGDIEWKTAGGSYEFELDCESFTGEDECWSVAREYECELQRNDARLDCERVTDRAEQFELDSEE